MFAKARSRRAVVAVQVLVLLAVLVGAAALTIDVGAMFNTRADLQRAADAGALAGASVYTTDEMMAVRMGTVGAEGLTSVVGEAITRTSKYSYVNPSLGTAHTNIAVGDILTGWINPKSGSEDIHTSVAPRDYNAVEVTARRQAGGGDSSNGPVTLLFARIFGHYEADVAATAAAMFDDRCAGVVIRNENTGFLPFTIHKDAFASELVAGGDSYGWDEGSQTVVPSPDNVREVRIYPYPLSGSGYTEGDGNFGTLNIGTGNQGVTAEVTQIQDGITDEDMIMEIGTAAPTFVDESGAPQTYDITGSPGMESSLKDALTYKIGEIVGFFLHDNVKLDGSNAIYRIVGIRFGRVMDMNLTNKPSTRGLWIQPVSYTGNEVIITEDAPSSGGLVGRLVICR